MTRHRRRFPRPRLARPALAALAVLGAACARAASAPEKEHAPAPAKPRAEEHGPAPEPASPPAAAISTQPEKAAPAAALEADHTATAAAKAPAPAARKSKGKVKVNTEELAGLVALGNKLTDRKDYDSAEIAYRQVLDTPGAPDESLKTALLALAKMYRRQGAQTKAAAIYEKFLKEYPGDTRTPDALLELGRTLRALGVHKLAIARFYSVINSTLKVPGEGFDHYQMLARTAQFEIAETYFLGGDFAEATKFYSRLRLLDLAPVDRARAHFKAGYAMRLQGNLEGAVTNLRGFIDQWPDDENVPEARYLLAVSLRELKRPQEAFAATLELLRAEKSRVGADPKRWAYWQRRTGNQLANDFFETGDALNAATLYANLLELAPEPAWRIPLTYQLALCHDRLGDTRKARDTYRAVIDAAGKEPAADAAELARMSAWRIEHLGWRDDTGRKISSLYDPGLGQAPAVPAAPAASPSPTAPNPAATP
jgi:TolA-binding protein